MCVPAVAGYQITTLRRPEGLPRDAVLPGTLVCVNPTGASAATAACAFNAMSANAAARPDAALTNAALNNGDGKIALQVGAGGNCRIAEIRCDEGGIA